MTEEHQADLLARWLASGGQGPPPEGVDDDALAAVYALRPDLAPAPRATAGDILADVTAGPFAEVSADDAHVVPFPVPASAPAAPPPADVPVHEDGGWRRWLGAGGAGLLAAAAAAMLVFTAALPEQAAPEADDAVPSTSTRDDAGSLFRRSAPKAEPVAPAAAEKSAPVATPMLEDEAVTGRLTESRARKKSAPMPRRALYGDDAAADAEEEAEAEPTRAPPPPERAAPATDVREADGALGQTALQQTALEAQNTAYGQNTASAKDDADVADEIQLDQLSFADGEAAAPAGIPESEPQATYVRALRQAQVVAKDDPLAAARMMKPLLVRPASVGQDAAVQGATWAMQGSDLALAQWFVDEGLSLGDDARLRALQARLAASR